MLSKTFNYFSDTLTIIWSIPVIELKRNEDILSPIFSPPDPLSRNSWRLEVSKTEDPGRRGLFLRKIGTSDCLTNAKITLKISIRDARNHRIVSSRIASWILFTDPTIRVGWSDLLSIGDVNDPDADGSITNSAAATDGGEKVTGAWNRGSEAITIKSRLLFHESCLDQRIRERALKLILIDLSELLMDRTFLNVRFHSELPNGSSGCCNSLRIEKAHIQQKCDLIIKLIARKMMEYESIAESQTLETSTSQIMRERMERLSVVESIIEFCMKGFIDSRFMSPVFALKLFIMSHRYKIKYVKRFAEDILIRNLNEDCVLVTVIHAKFYSSTRLMTACIQFLAHKYLSSPSLITMHVISQLPGSQMAINLHPQVMEKLITALNKDRVRVRHRKETIV